MDKTSTANNGTDNVNKDKTGSRQALRKLLENAKVHFMQLGLKRKTVIFVMSTFIGAVLFTSFIFGVIYSNTWKRTVINHVKSIESAINVHIWARYDFPNVCMALAFLMI